jgi:hypothetical protein
MTTPVLEAAASAQRDALAERIFKATRLFIIQGVAAA